MGLKERQWLPEADQMQNTTQKDFFPPLVREEEGIRLGRRKVFQMWSWQVPGTDQRLEVREEKRPGFFLGTSGRWWYSS